MSNGVFNAAKGRIAYYASLPGVNDALVLVLVKAAGLEPDDVLNNHASLAAVLTASNDECDFSGYSRKVIAAAVVAINNVDNVVDIDLPDQVWATAGGAVNNAIGKALLCYRPDPASADSAVLPLFYFDAAASTDGTDLVAEVAAAGVCRIA